MDTSITLFIAGKNTVTDDENLKLESIFAELFLEAFRFDIIDVLENPGPADNNDIFATPTFLIEHLEKQTKIVGAVINAQQISEALNIELPNPS